MNVISRKTVDQIEVDRPNTAKYMRLAGQVAEITYQRGNGIFQKMEYIHGEFTKGIRVADAT